MIPRFEVAHRAVLLSGARQIGKTTLLLQAIDSLIKAGVKLDPDQDVRLVPRRAGLNRADNVGRQGERACTAMAKAKVEVVAVI